MSTDMQLRGDSLRRQTELSRQYAATHNLELVGEFSLHDIGISAYKGANAERGQLARFIEAAEAGRIPYGSFLLVESLDRLSRQKPQNAISLLLRLIDLGINVTTLMDGRVYCVEGLNMMELITSIVIMSRAHEESDTKSQRLSAVWRNKRANIGAAKLSSICPAWVELSANRTAFQPIEERCILVQQIFDDAKQGLGSNAITSKLNRMGIKPFGRAEHWVESYVTKILQSRAVLGEYQPQTKVAGKRQPVGEPVLDYFPRIIDDDTFYAVQSGRRLRNSGGGGRRGKTQPNLFTHIATCGYCGAPMQLINKGAGPKGGIYLRCRTRVRGAGCVSTAWRYEDFERSFLFFTREIDLQSILEAAEHNLAGQQIDTRREGLREKLSAAILTRDRTFQLLSDDKLDVDFITRKLADVQIEIQNLEVQLEACAKAPRSLQPTCRSPAEIIKEIDQLQTLKGDAAFERRARVSHELRKMIVELSLKVEGTKVHAPRFVEDLTKTADLAFCHELIVLRDDIRDGKRASPMFLVRFVDGTCRTVWVDNRNPLLMTDESVYVPEEASSPPVRIIERPLEEEAAMQDLAFKWAVEFKPLNITQETLNQ